MKVYSTLLFTLFLTKLVHSEHQYQFNIVGSADNLSVEVDFQETDEENNAVSAMRSNEEPVYVHAMRFGIYAEKFANNPDPEAKAVLDEINSNKPGGNEADAGSQWYESVLIVEYLKNGAGDESGYDVLTKKLKQEGHWNILNRDSFVIINAPVLESVEINFPGDDHDLTVTPDNLAETNKSLLMKNVTSLKLGINGKNTSFEPQGEIVSRRRLVKKQMIV